MSLSKDEILDAISEMTVMEVVELVDAMEEKFGVTAAAAVAAVPVAGGGADGDAESAEEQTEFDVVLAGTPEKRIDVIKVVRALTGSGLKDAKEMVDNVPSTVKEQVSKDEADEAKAKLEEAGATVELK